MYFLATSKRHFPPVRWLFCSFWCWLAFGLGTGLLRPGPGTWGTALAWLMWWAGLSALSTTQALILVAVTFVFGCWLCDRVGAEKGGSVTVALIGRDGFVFFLYLTLSLSD